MKRQLFYPVLLVCLLFAPYSWSLNVDNQSGEDSIQVQHFVTYLIKNKIVTENPTHRLIITEANVFEEHSTFKITQMFATKAFRFDNTIYFRLVDSSETTLFEGYVIGNHPFIHAQDYFFYQHHDFQRDNIDKQIKAILSQHYADTLIIDSKAPNFISDLNGNYTGYFKLEFKTYAWHGCLFDDAYELIDENTYLEMQNGIDFEPVFTFRVLMLTISEEVMWERNSVCTMRSTRWCIRE